MTAELHAEGSCSWTDGKRASMTASILGRSRGIVRLQGPGHRKTGSVEACSLLPPPTLTALSLPTMSVGISLYEVQAP